MSLTDWKMGALSQLGGAHILGRAHSYRNQDAFGYRSLSSTSFVAAVADGHGSQPYKYADEGARIAVDAALDVLERTVNIGSFPKGILPRLIGAAIVREWRMRVRLRHEEKRNLATEAQRTHYDTGDMQPFGTTLLALAVSDDYALAIQIGDGGIFYYDQVSGETHELIPRAEKLTPATTSLCQSTASEILEAKIVCLPTASLFLLMTDGITDPYDSLSGDSAVHVQWGTRFARQFEVATVPEVAADMNKLALQLAMQGGDDATVFFAYKPRVTPTENF